MAQTQTVSLWAAPFILAKDEAVTLGWFAWTHKRATACLLTYGALTLLVGAEPAFLIVFWTAAVVPVWWLAGRVLEWLGHPLVLRVWGLLIGRPVRAAWRLRRVYVKRWEGTMAECSLMAPIDNAVDAVPRIERFRVGALGDTLIVNPLLGFTVEDFQRNAESFAQAFGARSCRVYRHRVRRGWLWWRRSTTRARVVFMTGPDPLGREVPALPIPESTDIGAVPVGVQENGEPWTLRLYETHWFIAGAMRSGKSVLIWSLLRGLAPAVREGSVEVWVCDPKGGAELGAGEGTLFSRYADESVEAQIGLLEDARDWMDARLRGLKAEAVRLGVPVRKHVAAPGSPHLVVIVDELPAIVAHEPDPGLRKRAAAASSALLARGGAAGVTFIGATQDPRVEAIKFRNLFPSRVCLRIDEPKHVDPILGDGAFSQGGRPDLIRPDQQGEAYVRLLGVPEPTRVRVGHVTDGDIAELVRDYRPPSPLELGEAPPERPPADEPEGSVRSEAELVAEVRQQLEEAFEAPATPQLPSPAVAVSGGGSGIPVVILDVLSDGEPRRALEIYEAVCAHPAYAGWPRNSVGNRLGEMAKSGELVKVRRGVYQRPAA